MTIETHVLALVKAKQAMLRKQSRKVMVASLVVVSGGVLRHQWPLLGELMAIAGLLAVGWFIRGFWDAYQVDTKFNG